MDEKVYCEFRSDGVCRRCQRRIKTNPERTLAVCRMPCEHLGESVGKVKADCHCGNGAKYSPANICRRHGRCLPYYRPDPELLRLWKLRQPEASIYHLCFGCESFRPAKPPESS